MPYGSDSERDSYESRSEYEPTDDDLFYNMNEDLLYYFTNGVSTEKVKCHYDREISRFSNSFLSSALEGLTPDEYFTQHLLPYFKEQKEIEDKEYQRELDERREYESSPEYAFECFYSTVTDLICRSEIVEAKEFYDAEISHHDLYFLDGLSPEAFFSRLVEEDAEKKASYAREAEESRLRPLREKYNHLRGKCVDEMTCYFGNNIRTYYQNFLGLTGLESIADVQEVRLNPTRSFESEYLTLVAEAAKSRVRQYSVQKHIGQRCHPFNAGCFREEEGRFIPLYNSVDGNKGLFLERVVPELIAYFSKYLCPSDYITKRYTLLASTRPHWPSRIPTEFDIPTFVRDLLQSKACDVTYGDLLFQTVAHLSLLPPPKPAPTQMERDTWEIQRVWDDLSLDLSVKKDAIRGFRWKYGHDESVRIMKPILYFMSEEKIISFLR
jgi:hypothetical protein